MSSCVQRYEIRRHDFEQRFVAVLLVRRVRGFRRLFCVAFAWRGSERIIQEHYRRGPPAWSETRRL